MIDRLSRIAFALSAALLFIVAFSLMANAVWSIIAVLIGKGKGDFENTALTSIGYLVVGIAVIQVAKYYVEEELMSEREMRVASEARRSLTKLISTVAIAVFLEGLVIVFQVREQNVPYLIYPSILLITGIVMVLGLGVYQHLSVGVEEQVETKDRADERDRTK